MSVTRERGSAGDEVACEAGGRCVVTHSDFGSSDEGVFWAIAVLVVLVVLAGAALYAGIGG